MEVLLDPLLLLAQPVLGLAEVLADGMTRDKRLALCLVERPGRLEEGRLKVRLVEIQVLPVRVVGVEAERDWGEK